MGLMDILRQYTEPNVANAATSTSHFDEVAGGVPSATIGSGVAAAFRSDQTPPFANMVGQLFGQSDGRQQAGVVNQLLGSIGSGGLSGVAGGALASLFGSSNSTGTAVPALTAEQASQLTPDQVEAIAAHAERHDPGIVDKVSAFYGEHPQLVKTLGGVALAIVLGKMAR